VVLERLQIRHDERQVKPLKECCNRIIPPPAVGCDFNAVKVTINFEHQREPTFWAA
jgi:hypothetical protein